jgi:hypothetical protein
MSSPDPVRLRLYSRLGCHLCDQMRREVDELLADRPREWDIVDVDGDPELARRYGETLPILLVNGRIFARVRLPRLAWRLRLLRAADRKAEPLRTGLA